MHLSISNNSQLVPFLTWYLILYSWEILIQKNEEDGVLYDNAIFSNLLGRCIAWKFKSKNK